MMDREKPVEVCKATGRGERSGPSIHGAAESPRKGTDASGVHSSDVEIELREDGGEITDREKPVEVCKATGRGERSGPSIHGAAESPGKDTKSKVLKMMEEHGRR